MQHHLQQLANLADNEREARQSRALAEYDGKGRPALVTKPGEPNDNIAVNYASLIVDKGVSFLFGEPPPISIKPKGAATNSDTKAEDVLEEIWPEDERAEDLIDLATNGGIFGDVWARIDLVNGEPSVAVLDPLNMEAIWSTDSYKDVHTYRCQYETFDAAGEPLTRRQDTVRDDSNPKARIWWIRDYQSRPNSLAWQELHEPIKWPFPFAPVFHIKNLPKANEFYGKPDLTLYVLALAHYLNRVDSLINRIVRIFANPKPVAKGLKSQDMSMGGEILFLPSLDQDLKLLEMTSDLSGALSFRKQLREALAEVSHVPEVATSKTESVGQLSGRALQIMYGPLVDRTKIKRRLYGRFLKALVSGLLEVKGIRDQKIEIGWGELLPVDEKESAETALNFKQIGVSNETLQERLGFDPEQEKIRNEAAGGDMSRAILKAFDSGEGTGFGSSVPATTA